MLTPERIAELRALLAKATAGPWDTASGVVWSAVESRNRTLYMHDDDTTAANHNGQLIVALRNDAAALLDMAEIGLGRTCYDASAERAAKWKACAEELATVIRKRNGCDRTVDYNRSPYEQHDPACRKCAALARFDALAKEEA